MMWHVCCISPLTACFCPTGLSHGMRRWNGWRSTWGLIKGRKEQRCTLPIWLLVEDFQEAYEGVVGFGDRVWCDSGGVEVSGPGCLHIFAILGGVHALH